jgi:hypothetical protein
MEKSYSELKKEFSSNLSNELGISKNRMIEILLEMGYTENSIIKGLYGTKHWFQEQELSGFFFSDDDFRDFVKFKLTK